MLFTRERARARWSILAIAWVMIAGVVIVHGLVRKDYVALLDSAGRRGAETMSTPLQRPIPTFYADAQTWVRHALSLLETNAWRVRFTSIDNAPFGREVHWNSGFAWLIAIEGWLRHKITGEPLPLAVERGLAWFNAPLLLGLAILFSGWTARRAGAAAGVFVGLSLVGNSETYLSFAPDFADHHGLLAMANFGVVLGAMFMGAGWWRGSAGERAMLLPESRKLARGGAIFSALSGAAGMWISSASVIPAIGITGVAALASTLWQGRKLQAQGAVFDASLWRLWGKLGAAVAFAFYLLEYAPHHLGLRLEVNHPFYALAWWGGSELVARLCEWRLGIDPEPAARRLTRLLLPVAAVAVPLVTILVGGTKVFIVRDPMILQLSARVSEGLSLVKAATLLGGHQVWLRLPWALAAVVPAAFLLWRGRSVDRLPLAFALVTCLAFLGLGFFQVRFFANAGGAETCAILAAMMALAQTWGQRARWIAAVSVTLVLCVPERLYALHASRETVRQRAVSRLDLMQSLYRDIAVALRTSQPEGEIVLLTNPNASTSIGYYGRLKTIGTLYWENLAGVKAAATMTSATTAESARELMQSRGVTHFVVMSEEAFVQEYYELAHPNAKPDEWRACIALNLFLERTVPLWLEKVPYDPPADIDIPELRVMIYKTRFGSAAAEAAWTAANKHVVTGDLAAAEQSLDQALALARDLPEYRVLKIDLALARGARDEAWLATKECLPLTRGPQQIALASALGAKFYAKREPAAAAELFRASLEARYDPTIAANLGWILATTRDDSVRNGAAALALAERLMRENPPSYESGNVLAAALAETGRFEEATAAGSRALELARAAGNAKAIALSEARLRTYQRREAWRE